MNVEDKSAMLANLAARAKARERELSVQMEMERNQKEKEEKEREEIEVKPSIIDVDTEVNIQEEEAIKAKMNGTAMHEEEEKVIKVEDPEDKVLLADPEGQSIEPTNTTSEHKDDTKSLTTESPPPGLASSESSPSQSQLNIEQSSIPIISETEPTLLLVDSARLDGAPETLEDPPEATVDPAEEPLVASEGDAGLSNSWAQVQVSENGQAHEVAAETEKEKSPVPTVEEPLQVAQPEPSRAELWNDIKILCASKFALSLIASELMFNCIAFTRTITSLYILTLLTLQTHVQLSLLGRSSYVHSVLSTLSPSGEEGTDEEMKMEFKDDDLEQALYRERNERVGVDKETERKYLTFSWWLLHRGWEVVGERVKMAVEEVVGP